MAEYKLAIRNTYLMRHLMTSALIFGGMMVYITSGAFIMIDRIGLSEQAFSYSQFVFSASYIIGAACVQPGYRLLGAHRSHSNRHRRLRVGIPWHDYLFLA